MTMPQGIDNRIVILEIDEKSLGEIGHWPWRRSLMAEAVEKLFDRYGAKLVGFDVVWAERDASSGIEVLDALASSELKAVPAFQAAYARLREELDFDGRFAAALRGRPVVLGYYFSRDERAVRVNAIPEPVLPKGSLGARGLELSAWTGYTGNLPIYLKSAAAAGHFNPLPDIDGVMRRVPMILEFEGAYYESFSLAMVRAYLGLQSGSPPRVEPVFPPQKSASLEWLKVGPLSIPVDETGSALIPYRGKSGSFAYVSLADVIKDRVAPERLRGRIVLIGATAPGLLDLRSTPVENVYPGVEIHANLIAGMIDRDIKQKPRYVQGAEVVMLLVGGAVLSAAIPMLSALWASAAAALGLALITALNFLVWNEANLVLPLAASMLMIASLYTMNMAYGYFVESRSKRQFAELFGQYVPPELVDKMAEDPGRYNMEPRSAELTILFSDVRGFTGISEALKPDELREYINEYLTSMSSIIRSRYRGTLDKYIGDAIMAFWGAPVDDAQHARNAVLAALEMQRQCRALNQTFAARGWPPLTIGVGVNSGRVRVGDMGSQVRRAYTVMGDPVNVASRLEGRTKGYGVGILVGETTRRQVPDVLFREVDRIKVKGKEEAVVIYEPLGLQTDIGEPLKEELRLWNQALRAYRAQQWDQADVHLLNLARVNPGCELYRRYAERVGEKRRYPPPRDWDGVTVFEEK